jgi:hypothetical protein
MFTCEDCDDDVEEVLRHREYGMTVTHRVTRWLCRDCHPTAPAVTAPETRKASAETVVTDGGAVTGTRD